MVVHMYACQINKCMIMQCIYNSQVFQASIYACLNVNLSNLYHNYVYNLLRMLLFNTQSNVHRLYNVMMSDMEDSTNRIR